MIAITVLIMLEDIVVKQKHYIDIENLREEDTDITACNCSGFEKGDFIQITEKFDGSNACIAYNAEAGYLASFSRTRQLTYDNTLNGFWKFVNELPPQTVEVFELHADYRVFGEWNNKNRIVYNDTYKVNHFYVFDIFDVGLNEWLPQNAVKEFVKEAGLEYIHVLYEGPFISWDHCRSFMNSPAYGEYQEGIVVKNQDKLHNNVDSGFFYLKIVNDGFKETIKIPKRIPTAEESEAKAEGIRITESIVTRNRVEKMLFKLRDEGLLPEKLTPADMKDVAKALPKRIYDDCLKEEKESVMAAGEYLKKSCSSVAMKHAREILMEQYNGKNTEE